MAHQHGSFANDRSPSSSNQLDILASTRTTSRFGPPHQPARDENSSQKIPKRFFAPRFGGSDWIGVRLDESPDGPDWDEVGEILTDAYRQRAPKKLIAQLDAD